MKKIYAKARDTEKLSEKAKRWERERKSRRVKKGERRERESE